MLTFKRNDNIYFRLGCTLEYGNDEICSPYVLNQNIRLAYCLGKNFNAFCIEYDGNAIAIEKIPNHDNIAHLQELYTTDGILIGYCDKAGECICTPQGFNLPATKLTMENAKELFLPVTEGSAPYLIMYIGGHLKYVTKYNFGIVLAALTCSYLEKFKNNLRGDVPTINGFLAAATQVLILSKVCQSHLIDINSLNWRFSEIKHKLPKVSHPIPLTGYSEFNSLVDERTSKRVSLTEFLNSKNKVFSADNVVLFDLDTGITFGHNNTLRLKNIVEMSLHGNNILYIKLTNNCSFSEETIIAGFSKYKVIIEKEQ